MGKHLRHRIQKADPAARRRALFLLVPLVVLAFAGVVGAVFAAQKIDYLIEVDPGRAFTHIEWSLRFLGTAIAVFAAILAVWLWRFSSRVYDDERFPPNGFKVIHDTRIRTGDEARSYARKLFYVALLSGLMGMVVMLTLRHVLKAAATGFG
jgi:heme A synthase